jgi:hypothetical protein
VENLLTRSNHDRCERAVPIAAFSRSRPVVTVAALLRVTCRGGGGLTGGVPASPWPSIDCSWHVCESLRATLIPLRKR